MSTTGFYVAELALRSAVNTAGTRDLTSESAKGQASSIKDAALEKLTSSSSGTDSSSSSKPQLSSLQTAAIEAAVVCLVAAYTAISRQLDVLDNQRLSFDKEREAGIASFMLPHNKEERDLSKEEKVIKDFLDLANKYPDIAKYMGIHSAELSTEQSCTYYSVLPFYRMSEDLAKPLASTRPLDRQRSAITLFLKSAMPEAIKDIDVGFQKDYKFIAFWESTFRGKNYLNNRRAPRFIMMCLANLLWNIQHPVDPETGFPLSLNRSIQICRNVELYLNQLLDPKARPYIDEINNHENEITSFMRKLEVYTQTLRAAYAEEQLHGLNFYEVTNSAHRALRIMDKSLFELIYKRFNPLTKKEEPDKKAAETIADMISYINLLLRRNPSLVGQLQPIPQWITKASGMNIPLLSTVDVLILFAHLSWQERDEILEKLEKSTVSSELEFAKTMRRFYQKFIKPIKAVCKAELNATSFSPKRQEVGRLTAQRLIPFLTLVIEDYRLDVDTEETYEQAKRSQENPANGTVLYSGKQQAQAINAIAQAGGCGLVTMTTDPTERPFRLIERILDGKDAVILFEDRLFYADIRKQEVKEIIAGEVRQHEFNALKLAVDARYKLADSDVQKLIQLTTGRAQVGGGYYTWALSPFTEGTTQLDELPKCQYRLTQVTKLMVSVSELVGNYRSFLLHKSFQRFLIRCLEKVKAENAELERRLIQADESLDHNERVSRGLQAILRPMTFDLNSSLSEFTAATECFVHVVSAPDFTDQQRQLLTSKVSFIAEQFSNLFAEDSGLAELIGSSNSSKPSTPSVPLEATLSSSFIKDEGQPSSPVARKPTDKVDASAVLALRALVQNCHNALSFQSRVGRKGLLLREMLCLIDQTPTFTEAQMTHVVMELTRIALTSRQTIFFQAAYGHARSAKVLIAAIKDQKLNDVLPLASIIFGQVDIEPGDVNDALIMKRLTRLRDKSRRWQESSEDMRLRWPDFSPATEAAPAMMAAGA